MGKLIDCVVAAFSITVPAGTKVRLNADQYRRRKHILQLSGLQKKDAELKVYKITGDVGNRSKCTFKRGELIGIDPDVINRRDVAFLKTVDGETISKKRNPTEIKIEKQPKAKGVKDRIPGLKTKPGE